MSGNDNNHPAYQHILDVIPDSLHSVVIPELKKWDAGVTQKFQEIHSQYESLKPFQQFVENGIDPNYAEQAVILADQLQRDPAKVVSEINNSWKLGFVDPEQAKALQTNQSNSGEDDSEFDFSLDDTDDLMKNPKIKAMYEALEQVQNELKSQKELEEEERELQEFEEELDSLEESTKESNLPFNRLFVTAMMQQGLSGEDAVKQYHQALAISTADNSNETQQTNSTENQPPVVMGSEGTAGSGTSNDPVNFGSLSKNQLNSTIEQILAQAAESGQG